jgi:hypothetical protein
LRGWGWIARNRIEKWFGIHLTSNPKHALWWGDWCYLRGRGGRRGRRREHQLLHGWMLVLVHVRKEQIWLPVSNSFTYSVESRRVTYRICDDCVQKLCFQSKTIKLAT